jgi:hypothetical protein
MEEGSRNSYVKIEPNAGCMAQINEQKIYSEEFYFLQYDFV